MTEDADERRAAMLDNWERASVGWEKRADRVRQFGMPVSEWMVRRLELAPGQRVLELAAGPGDTGFMAAASVLPGGSLISSDASDAMLEVARARAAEQGVQNVEFKQLQLEWIDLPTASVDAVLCRWGIMLSLDPSAALTEIRRVLAPGGRMAAAVWDLADRNPWASIPGGALVSLGFAPPPDRDGPGMFALAAPGSLEQRLADAGFVEWEVEPVAVARNYDDIDDWLDEQLDLSLMFADAWRTLDGAQRERLLADIASRAAPFTRPDGRVELPGSSLVALAHA